MRRSRKPGAWAVMGCVVAAAWGASAAPPAAGRPAATAPSRTERADPLLRRMQTERDDVAFEGLRVQRRYGRAPQGSAAPYVVAEEVYYRLVHPDGRTWRSERLVAGAGSPAQGVTIRSGEESFVGAPGAAVWHRAVLPPAGDELADLELALRNYEAVVEARETVAGRPAVRIRLTPRRAGRPSLVLWLDAEREFRLGVLRLGVDGQPLREVVYERIRYGAEADQALFRPPAGAAVLPARAREDERVEPVAVQTAVDFPVLLPEWLPEGFQPTTAKVSTYRVRDAAGRMVAQHRVHLGYGDGITTISLFEARGRAPAAFRPPYTATQEHEFQVLTTYREGLALTLVGEISQEDLGRMLGSVSAGRLATRTRQTP